MWKGGTRPERVPVALASLVFTWAFFIEYLPGFKRVHIPYDLDGFHYPLLDYAFRSLRQGRLPECDPTMYCGISFVGNVQAALFYPPNWILFAANLGRRRLSFQSLEILVMAQYLERMKAFARTGDARFFDLQPSEDHLLRALGVRYFITSQVGEMREALLLSPNFRLLEPSQSFNKVFELKDPQPPYRLKVEDPLASSSIQRIAWTPECREFLVRSAARGRFVLVEQFFPGWHATLDGRSVPIERYEGAFQAVPVPPGHHRVRFEFRSPGLRLGAVVTVLSLIGLWVGVRRPGAPARKGTEISGRAAGMMLRTGALLAGSSLLMPSRSLLTS